MKNGRIVFSAGLAVLLVVGLMVSAAMAHNHEKKACCGSCGGATEVAASEASVAACTVQASKQCPVQQFMTRVSRVDLTESQIQKMMVIWTETEKKMTALLTPTQLVKLKAPLPIQEQLAAQVVAKMTGTTKAATKACCGSCEGAKKVADKACCGTCGGSETKSCPAGCTKTCCSGS